MNSVAKNVTAVVYAANGQTTMIEEINRLVALEMRTAEVRGIVQFHLSQKKFVDYLSIANALGMFSGGSELAGCLGRIMTEDFNAKRPLSCSIVISKNTRRPGRGFFGQARTLGFKIGATPDAETAFWEEQVKALGMELRTDPTLLPNLRMSLARKLWLSKKRTGLLFGLLSQGANELAASIVHKKTGEHGRLVASREDVDDVAVVKMPDGVVIAVGEDSGPVAAVIGLLNADGVFEMFAGDKLIFAQGELTAGASDPTRPGIRLLKDGGEWVALDDDERTLWGRGATREQAVEDLEQKKLDLAGSEYDDYGDLTPT